MTTIANKRLYQFIFLCFTFVIQSTLEAQVSAQQFELNGIEYQYVQLNEVDNPKALLVLFDGGAGIAARIPLECSIPDSAAQYGVLCIGIDQSEFYLSDENYARLSTVIMHVMDKHKIEDALYLGGFSIGGFTAVRLAEMAVEKGDDQIRPAAVFGVDPPLDHLDFVDYCHRELDRECASEEASRIGKGEAEWILGYYQENFGSVEENADTYVRQSCFSSQLADGGNAQFLLDIPILLVHEIDPMWLIKERCRVSERRQCCFRNEIHQLSLPEWKSERCGSP